jgi:hypothetical protein
MPGNARLRLAQNVCEIGDREFALNQQRKDSQARFFSRRAQNAQRQIQRWGSFLGHIETRSHI